MFTCGVKAWIHSFIRKVVWLNAPQNSLITCDFDAQKIFSYLIQVFSRLVDNCMTDILQEWSAPQLCLLASVKYIPFLRLAGPLHNPIYLKLWISMLERRGTPHWHWQIFIYYNCLISVTGIQTQSDIPLWKHNQIKTYVSCCYIVIMSTSDQSFEYWWWVLPEKFNYGIGLKMS